MAVNNVQPQQATADGATLVHACYTPLQCGVNPSSAPTLVRATKAEPGHGVAGSAFFDAQPDILGGQSFMFSRML
jgi:hypothetical protein